MDDLGFNKIAAAVLVTALGFMGLKEISHMMMHVEAPDVPAYALEMPEIGGDVEAVVEVPFPSPDFIAAMDATRGEKVFKKCLSCHNANDGGKHSTGPNLWNVVAQPAAAKDGFKYTAAMTNAGLTWNYEELNDYLTKPTKYVSGTAMNFVGLKKEADRAAVIEYLRQHASSPVAQPVAAAAPAEEMAEDITVPTDETVIVKVPAEDGVPQEAVPAEEAPTEAPAEKPEQDGSDH